MSRPITPRIKSCVIPNCDRKNFLIHGDIYYRHYIQNKRKNAQLASREEIANWFWRYAVPAKNPDMCWLWTGSKVAIKAGGYGRFELHYKTYKAHQVSFYLHNGFWALASVLHSCDVPTCSNPRHLRDGSQSDNMQDARERNRFTKGSKSSNAKLFEEQIPVIKRRIASGESSELIARTYGVTYQTIYDIQRGRTWSHII